MSSSRKESTRRDFLGATAGFALLSTTSAAGRERIQGASDRVRLGLIGCGTRGSQVADFFLRHQDAQYVAAGSLLQPSVGLPPVELSANLLRYEGSSTVAVPC